MKPAKLTQIRKVREAARTMRRDPHVDSCPCCLDDLNDLEENADAPYAPHLVERLRKRLALAADVRAGFITDQARRRSEREA